MARGRVARGYGFAVVPDHAVLCSVMAPVCVSRRCARLTAKIGLVASNLFIVALNDHSNGAPATGPLPTSMTLPAAGDDRPPADSDSKSTKGTAHRGIGVRKSTQ